MVYAKLDPVFSDFRRMRIRESSGELEYVYMDVFVDSLLREESYFDVKLPYLKPR